MKTNFTTLKNFAVAAAVLLTLNVAKAQCVTPAMSWHNPVLIAGTAGQPGAEYKFPHVTPGVNAIVKVLSLNGGATLSNIDEDVFGYSAAWQPVVKTPTVQGVTNSHVSFSIIFINEGTGTVHKYDCFQLSFIDVDGDGVGVKEYVAAKNPDSVSMTANTALTLTSLTGNMMQATGPITNFTNIDTAAWATNVNFKYSNKHQVNEVKVGSITLANYTPQDRYFCGYFAEITMTGAVTILPVKYSSIDAAAVENTVSLKWVTENEINNHHFEVERSFDGVNFATEGSVAAANGPKNTYRFTDNNAILKNNAKAFYRLKQVDIDGRIIYSSIMTVRLNTAEGDATVIEVSPNPFAESLNARFATTERGVANLQILNTGGQKVMTQQLTVVKGNNAIQMQGLAKLAPGVYVAQLVVNGVVVSNKKIIKN
jgi:hypothetical protein